MSENMAQNGTQSDNQEQAVKMNSGDGELKSAFQVAMENALGEENKGNKQGKASKKEKK